MTLSADIPTFKALLIDDHVLFGQGLRNLIKGMSPESEVTYNSNPDKAKEMLKTGGFEFLFSDLMIPGYNTKEFISYCRKNYPALIIIIISSTMDINSIKEYFGLGINGFISKNVDHYELKMALEKTWQGEKYISSDLSGRVANSFFAEEKDELTKKELEVLRLVAAGYTVDKTAGVLFVSPYTIMAHRRSIMKKLDLHSAAELVKYAFENNLH